MMSIRLKDGLQHHFIPSSTELNSEIARLIQEDPIRDADDIVSLMRQYNKSWRVPERRIRKFFKRQTSDSFSVFTNDDEMSFTSVTSRWTSTAEEIQTTTSVNDNLPLFEIHTNGSLLTPMKASFLECVEEEDFSLTAGLGTPFRSQNGLYTPNSMASPTPNEGGLNTYNANTFTTAAGNIENVGHHFVIAMDNTTRGSAMNDGEKMDLEVVRPRGLYDDDNDKKDERHCFCEGCSIM